MVVILNFWPNLVLNVKYLWQGGSGFQICRCWVLGLLALWFVWCVIVVVRILSLSSNLFLLRIILVGMKTKYMHGCFFFTLASTYTPHLEHRFLILVNMFWQFDFNVRLGRFRVWGIQWWSWNYPKVLIPLPCLLFLIVRHFDVVSWVL